MALNLTEDKSTLVQLVAQCRQAVSQYLSQYWPRAILCFGTNVLSEPILAYCIVKWTHRNKFQWNFNRNSNIFIQEIQILSFKKMQDVACSGHFVLVSDSQCVNSWSTAILDEMIVVIMVMSHYEWYHLCNENETEIIKTSLSLVIMSNFVLPAVIWTTKSWGIASNYGLQTKGCRFTDMF